MSVTMTEDFSRLQSRGNSAWSPIPRDVVFTTKSAGKGTGVGLALCNRIVASHGGSIQLDQKPGHGARFLIDLPTVAHAKAQ